MQTGSILTLGAGFVYVKMFGEIKGVMLASTVVWIGASVGATFAFINGRYLLRGIVTYYTAKSKKFALIDNVVGMNGFKVTFLLRLSPVTPYNVFNYFMGLTSVKLRDYIFACIGMIPDSIVYCFIGGSIASIAELSSVGFGSHPVLLIMTIVGTVVAIIGVVYISYVAKKEFNKMAEESRTRLERDHEENVNDGMLLNEEQYTVNGGRGSNNDDMVYIAAIHDINEEDLENDMECDYNGRHNNVNGMVLGRSLSDLRTMGPNNSLKDNTLYGGNDGA